MPQLIEDSGNFVTAKIRERVKGRIDDFIDDERRTTGKKPKIADVIERAVAVLEQQRTPGCTSQTS